MTRVVYIVESPSSEDFLFGRREGQSLSEMLKLSQIPNVYLVAIDEPGFDRAVEIVLKDFQERLGRETGPVMPFLHLSCHGTEDGLLLSNEDIISWDTLREKLNILNTAPTGTEFGSIFHLCISACQGLNAFQSDTPGSPSPFAALIGTIEKVEWVDALVAYTVYYHSFIYKELEVAESMERMNQSIGKYEMFQVYLGHDLKDKIENESRHEQEDN
jgi:hypothetical protein